MADKGCEYGRLLETRISALEKNCAEAKVEMVEMRKEILDKLESWWPKPLGLILSGMCLIIGALITALAMMASK